MHGVVVGIRTIELLDVGEEVGDRGFVGYAKNFVYAKEKRWLSIYS